MRRSRAMAWACSAVVVAAATAAAQETALDFARAQGEWVLDSAGEQRARLCGGARIVADGRDGGGALDLGGSERKGVASFGKGFATDRQGTIELWCKPRVLGGIFVGKYGAINIEFVRGQGRISFGLKLKDKGWIHCKSPERSVRANEEVRIKATWGKQGMFLFLDGNLAAHAELPESFDWFIGDREFLLGSYDWPGGYDVWFFDGLIDDFSYRPVQEPFDGETPTLPVKPAVFDPLLKETPKPNYGTAVPEAVTGRVVLDANADGVAGPDESGVAGVSVSDGYSVTKTDARGAYTLHPSPQAVFVFVTRPPEHDVVGTWYAAVSPSVDFTLAPAPLPEDEYTFVQVTDTHVSGDNRSVLGLNRFVREVNALDPPPRFVFNSGDLVNLDKQLKAPASTGHQYFRTYAGTMNHLNMPYYNVAGDHTDSGYRLEEFPRGDHRAGKALYWEYLGPNLFSFEYGRLHFLSVDVVYHLQKTSHTMVPEHLAWFEQDLAARSPDTIVLTASENPLETSIAGFVGLADRHDIRLQLVGDTHVVSWKRGPVPSRSHGALSGTWWNGPCADLSPQGYMVYQVRGTTLDCFYKGLGRRVSIIAPGYGALAGGRVKLEAHLVQPQPGETLQVSTDGIEWRPMAEVSRPFYRASYEAPWDTASEPDGLVEVRVRSLPEREVQTRVFVVDNDKPFPVADEGARLTFSVGSVIGAAQRPSVAAEVLLNGAPVGDLLPGQRKGYTFPVSAGALRKVNVLTFRLGRPDDLVSITCPLLTYRGQTIEDSRAAATQRVRANHWSQDLVRRSGFVLGEDPAESSFALRQGTFVFVLPDPPKTE